MAFGFEQQHKDIAGRVGRLRVGAKVVRTPALLPVINPHLQIVTPAEMHAMGVEALITNAYIFYRSDRFRDAALERGLHAVLDFPGVIMTDSGSFQLSVYGDVEVGNRETLAFQQRIGSEIVVPLDLPTPPSADRETAEAELATTLARIGEAREIVGDAALLAAPVQGGLFEDLREQAGRAVSDGGAVIAPIGAVVPLMENYRYRDLVRVVLAAKRGLSPGACVHLFGAGHPAMFALAAAMGCDLFDSAAYALYAKEGRYLTVHGTLAVAELADLPCSCAVCRAHSADELRRSPERERLLALHNLAVTLAEIARIRQAIQDGTLWELVDERCRSHPRLLDGYREPPPGVARARGLRPSDQAPVLLPRRRVLPPHRGRPVPPRPRALRAPRPGARLVREPARARVRPLPRLPAALRSLSARPCRDLPDRPVRGPVLGRGHGPDRVRRPRGTRAGEPRRGAHGPVRGPLGPARRVCRPRSAGDRR